MFIEKRSVIIIHLSLVKIYYSVEDVVSVRVTTGVVIETVVRRQCSCF